ncbi:MAG: LPS export ABC transporter permease LptG [Thermodesulfobacteriota bacterium]
MRIISHYISREFLKMTLLCLGIFIFLFLLLDVMGKLKDFSEAGVSTRVMMQYFAYTLPFIIKQLIPVAIVMGTQLTFGFFSKNNQLIAFKSSGINMGRLSFPILLLAMASTISLLILGEVMVPFAQGRAQEIWNVRVKKIEPRAVLLQEKIWYKGHQAIYSFSRFNFKDQTAEGVSLHFFDHGFKLQSRLDAASVVWKNGGWTFKNGLYQTFSPDGTSGSEPFLEKVLFLSETPEDFRYQEKTGAEMTYQELRKTIRKVQGEGYDATPYIVEKHIRLSFPFVCIIMALFGIALALRKEKGIGVAQGIVGSLFLAFLYWIFFGFSRSLGLSGTFPPLWAAWASNLLFLLVGGYLFLNIRQ